MSTGIHDDNFLTFTIFQTTLLLSAGDVTLNQTNCNVKTSRLYVFADRIIISGPINTPGKSFYFSCNDLEWSSNASISVKGEKRADTTETIEETNKATLNGGSGGTVVFNVHNLPPRQIGSTAAYTFLPGGLKIDVSGGDAGSAHKQGGATTDHISGDTGAAGSIAIISSDSVARALTALWDTLRDNSLDLSKRIQNLVLYANGLKEESTRLKLLTPEASSVKDTIDGLAAIFRDVTESKRLLLNTVFPPKLKTLVQSALAATDALCSSSDFASLFPTFSKDSSDFAIILLRYNTQQKKNAPKLPDQPDLTEDNISKWLDYFAKQTTAKLAEIAALNKPLSSPVALKISGLRTSLGNVHTAAKKQDSDNQAIPSTALSHGVASTYLNGMDSAAKMWPLVHPDQCQMMLRQADALFFAEDRDGARAKYQMLLERLRFVPPVLDQNQKTPPVSNPQTIPDEQRQLYALYRLEKGLQLSVWTLDSLSQIHQVVQSRLLQIALGYDMFNLAPQWAPRQSFQFYSDYSKNLLDILKQFENSYWSFLDAYQAQSQAVSGFREALVANVYRKKQIQDDIDRAWRAITSKETEIASAASTLNSKRDSLVQALHDSEAEFSAGKWHCPSAGSIVTAVTSVVVAAAAVFMAPFTAGTSLLALVGVGTGVAGAFDEAANTVEDSTGQRINKKLVTSQITTCEGDLDSLFKTAASLHSDGTLPVDADDTKKIAVSESQLRGFIKQFGDKVPDSVKTSLDEFVNLSNKRNSDILAYNNAIGTLFERQASKKLCEKQASELGSELVKENKCIPSIVAYYSRLRIDMRFSILRTVKQSALALRFWGLRDMAHFSTSGGLLSSLDELYAHMRVLLQTYEESVTRFSDFSQSTWPRNPAIGIVYKLNDVELAALKLAQSDAFSANRGYIHTTTIKSLAAPVQRQTTLQQSPFAGHSNVRLSTVHFWAPGIKLKAIEPANPLIIDSTRRVTVDIQHQGSESIVDPDNKTHGFTHTTTLITTQFDPRLCTKLEDTPNAAWTWQAMGTDWTSNNATAKILAPIGPFAEWRIAILSDVCGELDWTGVSAAYLEFCGSSYPFRR